MEAEFVRRAPPPALAGSVLRLTGYREAGGALVEREAATLVVPLVIGFGAPFRVALGDGPAVASGAFAAGLWAGHADIRSGGGAACVQADLTPFAAWRLFGGATGAMAGRLVDLGDLMGAEGAALPGRLAETPDWPARFALVERALAARLADAPAPPAEPAQAFRRLAATGGALRVGALARELGRSRKHLTERFRAAFGLPPKSVARILRFRRACALVRRGEARGWADVAAAAGFADQAHLTREFAALAGESPVAWARRAAVDDRRFGREAEEPADW